MAAQTIVPPAFRFNRRWRRSQGPDRLGARVGKGLGMMRTHYRLFYTFLCAPLLCAPCLPAQAATPGVTTIANPGGGTIAYAQLPQQHDTKGAMSKVLQYATTALGGRPTIDKEMQSPDGNSLALTFTVKPAKAGSAEISGLALVSASKDGPGAGAVLSDTTDHFRTSLKPMLARLQQEAVAKGGSAGAQAAIANAGGGSDSSAKPGAASSASSSAGTLSGVAPKPSAPPAKLIQTTIPDGAGTIGLPEGWRITAAHAGDVRAQGPNGESLRFGMAQSVADPNTQSRTLLNGPLHNFVSIPFGTPADQAYTEMVDQLARYARQTPPTIKYVQIQQFPDTKGGGKNTLLVADVSTPAGPVVSWTEVSTSMQLAMGSWQMTIYNIAVPPALADKEAATVASMFPAYKPNYAAIQAQGTADFQQGMRTFAYTSYVNGQLLNSSALSTQQTTNYLLGQTVVNDSALNAHGTVSDDVANALIAANPNRFQAVPGSGMVRGIDY